MLGWKNVKVGRTYFQTPFISRAFNVIFIYIWRFFTGAEEALAQKILGLQVDFLIFLAQEKDICTISSIHVHCFINPKVGRALGKITHECFLFRSIVFISSILYYVLNVPQFTQLIFCSFEVLRKHAAHLLNLLKIISLYNTKLLILKPLKKFEVCHNL